MFQCPNCKYQGYINTGECATCQGKGVVVTLFEVCNNCKGKGCWQCQSHGRVVRPIPFVEPIVRISGDILRECFLTLRVGYTTSYTQTTDEDILGYSVYNEEKVIPNAEALGLIAVLIQISDERSGRSSEHGEWINSILEDADAILIEPSGLWLEHNDQAIRIYTYPVT